MRSDLDRDMTKKPIRAEELAELHRLATLSDDTIDTSDISEAPAENWALARRGDLCRPIKQPVTIRLDVDVLAWFEEHASGVYQTEINRVPRSHMANAQKR